MLLDLLAHIFKAKLIIDARDKGYSGDDIGGRGEIVNGRCGGRGSGLTHCLTWTAFSRDWSESLLSISPEHLSGPANFPKSLFLFYVHSFQEPKMAPCYPLNQIFPLFMGIDFWNPALFRGLALWGPLKSTVHGERQEDDKAYMQTRGKGVEAAFHQ